MPLNIEPVSSVDSVWLSMEDPTNLMMVSGVISFESPPDFDAIKANIQSRFLRFRRFRQRIVQPKIPLAPASWSPWFWETDPDFDIDNHMHEITLEPDGYRHTIRELVGNLISTPLDFDRPLWEMHLIHGFGEGSVLVARMHHCVADGIALIHVLLSMTDDRPDAPPPPPPPDPEPEGKNNLLEEAVDALVQRASTAANTMLKFYGKVLHEALDAVSNPGKAVDLAQRGSDGAQTVRRLLLRSDDPKTRFKGTLGTDKRVAWSNPTPMEDVKAVRRALGGTINDVLISSVAGGLRRYLQQHKDEVNDLNFRSAIPVNLRKSTDTHSLGNKFGLVFLSLPIGIDAPAARLREVRRRMDRLKSSQEAPLFFGLIRSLGYTPPELQAPIVSALADKITAVMSNVPGPSQPLYMAGQKVEHVMFWVPQAGRVGLGISVLSYAGNVLIGVNTDAALVPDPERIVEGFYEEFRALQEAAEQVQHHLPAAEPSREDGRCGGFTKQGKPCRNRALPGSTRCRLHPVELPLEDPDLTID